ncbi:MAG: TolC family protein, partial [Myxococcales bacterium]|nr:TolC family protein [Myxococcales bacterium]
RASAAPVQDSTPGDSAPANAIDLETALKLARVSSPRVAAMRAAEDAARADLAAARVAWLPTVRLGASYHFLDGAIQESGGTRLSLQRSAAFVGSGAGAAAAGPTPLPGVSLHVDLASAIFDPLARKQDVRAMEAVTRAAEADVALAVSVAYYELVRQHGRLQIARQATQESATLVSTMESFAQTGEGLQSNASRALVAFRLRQAEEHTAQADLARATARLAVLLHLEQPDAWALRPALDELRPIDVVTSEADVAALVTRANARRSELQAHDAVIAGAEASLRKERLGVLLPTLSGGASGGGFAGNTGANPGGLAGRGEFLFALYWEVENLGAGHVARARRERAQLRRARSEKESVVDTITIQVREAHADLEAARLRIDATHAAVAPAQRAYDLDRQRVFEKHGLPVELLQSLDALVEARTRHLDALVDFNVAQHQLLYALGGP